MDKRTLYVGLDTDKKHIDGRRICALSFRPA